MVAQSEEFTDEMSNMMKLKEMKMDQSLDS